MRAVDHYIQAEEALREARQEIEVRHYGAACAWAEIAQAEAATAGAAARIAGPHRDPVLDAAPLPHGSEVRA